MCINILTLRYNRTHPNMSSAKKPGPQTSHTHVHITIPQNTSIEQVNTLYL